MAGDKAFKAEMEAKLKELSEAMDEIQTKAESLEHDTQVECMKHVKEFREIEPIAWEHLDELAKAGEAEAEKFESDVESTIGELEAEVEKATALFENKPEN